MKSWSNKLKSKLEYSKQSRKNLIDKIQVFKNLQMVWNKFDQN